LKGHYKPTQDVGFTLSYILIRNYLIHSANVINPQSGKDPLKQRASKYIYNKPAAI